MTETEFLDKLLPEWRSDKSYYTDEMFLKHSKNRDMKMIMQNLRVYYGKNSKRQAGCFCTRGIRLILEWLIKQVKAKLEEEAKDIKETKDKI